MSCKPRARSRLLAQIVPVGFSLLALIISGCNRSRRAPEPPQRVAVLRAENLSPTPSLDWMGRAISEILAAELAVPSGPQVVAPATLRQLVTAMGLRPAAAPGISAEREAALAAGANRIVSCEFSAARTLRLACVVQDAGSQKDVRRAVTEAPRADDVLGAAAAMARQLSADTRPFDTRNPDALRAYAEALDQTDPDAALRDFARAVAADPNFGLAYLAWLRAEVTRGDRAGAERVLAMGQARGNAIAEYERAQLALDAADLHHDAGARLVALAALARSGPPTAAVFRSLGDADLEGRRYREAVLDYRRALALAPDDIQILNTLGYVLAYAGSLQPALEVLHRYQDLRPQDANSIDSQGDVNFYFSRFGEAEKLYLAAFEKSPKFLGGGELLKAAQARLAAGDLQGADAIFRRYAAVLAERHDSFADDQQAAWRYLTGRRREAVALLETAAARRDPAQASGLHAQLAIWYMALGDRAAASRQAALATPAPNRPVPVISALAVLVTQADAAPAEWDARAARLFPQPAQGFARDLAAASALILHRQVAAALPFLRRAWQQSNPSTQEGLPVLFAWSLIESNQWDASTAGISALVGPTPLPPPALGPLESLYFPRIFFLRARNFEHLGKHDQALENYRLFLKLSGQDAEIWGHEEQARKALGN